MKKICIVVLLVLSGLQNLYAQDISFGASAGLFLGSANLQVAGFDISNISSDLDVLDGAGFYAGLLADVELIGQFHLQPEMLYANIGGESVIIIPLMAKYYLAEKINLQAGPQLDFVLDVPSIVKEVVNTIGFSMAVGTGYDISEKISVQAKYSFGLNDRIDKNINNLLDTGSLLNLEPSLKTNILQAGITYKF